MDEILLTWLKKNVGKEFVSPRKGVFGGSPSSIRIVELYKNKIIVDFVSKRTNALPLYYWMFDRAFIFISSNKEKMFMLGAKVQGPFAEGSIEGEIWMEPYPYSSPYKVSPHICDILALAGFAAYGYTINPKTRRRVQGIKYVDDQYREVSAVAEKQNDADLRSTKPIPININLKTREGFIRKYRQTIILWTENNERKIIENRSNYRWKHKTTAECVKERNDISRDIILSRIKHEGGVDLKTLDKIIKWGFNRKFPLRNPDEALRITRNAFKYLDTGNIIEATRTLLNISGIGISRASKILGLFDQENLCIYDSRVGNTLRELKYENEKIILCPPGRTIQGDIVTGYRIWADQYQKLIWTLEIIRDYMNEKGQTFRLADVEMGLFMMGK